MISYKIFPLSNVALVPNSDYALTAGAHVLLIQSSNDEENGFLAHYNPKMNKWACDLIPVNQSKDEKPATLTILVRNTESIEATYKHTSATFRYIAGSDWQEAIELTEEMIVKMGYRAQAEPEPEEQHQPEPEQKEDDDRVENPSPRESNDTPEMPEPTVTMAVDFEKQRLFVLEGHVRVVNPPLLPGEEEEEGADKAKQEQVEEPEQEEEQPVSPSWIVNGDVHEIIPFFDNRCGLKIRYSHPSLPYNSQYPRVRWMQVYGHLVKARDSSNRIDLFGTSLATQFENLIKASPITVLCKDDPAGDRLVQAPINFGPFTLELNQDQFPAPRRNLCTGKLTPRSMQFDEKTLKFTVNASGPDGPVTLYGRFIDKLAPDIMNDIYSSVMGQVFYTSLFKSDDQSYYGCTTMYKLMYQLFLTQQE